VSLIEFEHSGHRVNAEAELARFGVPDLITLLPAGGTLAPGISMNAPAISQRPSPLISASHELGAMGNTFVPAALRKLLIST